MEKEAALSKIKDSRLAFLNAIAGLTPEELTTIPVEGIWTTKDLIGHITAWENALLEPLSLFVNGKHFQANHIPDHDAWNAEQAARRAAWDFSETQKEMEVTRQDLIRTAEKLTEDQWNQAFRAPWGDQNTISEMISGLAWHEAEHTKSILKTFLK